MKRHASLGVAIAVVWAIAFFGAAAVALLLFLRLGWPEDLQFHLLLSAAAFVTVFAPLAVWAAITTRALVVEHRNERGVLRRGWPAVARRGELEALDLLDRRGQPGSRATIMGDVVADLRRDDRSERTFEVTDPSELWVAMEGLPDASLRLFDVDLHLLAEVFSVEHPRQLYVEPGTYRAVIERAGIDDGSASQVWGWWIGATSAGASS